MQKCPQAYASKERSKLIHLGSFFDIFGSEMISNHPQLLSLVDGPRSRQLSAAKISGIQQLQSKMIKNAILGCWSSEMNAKSHTKTMDFRSSVMLKPKLPAAGPSTRLGSPGG